MRETYNLEYKEKLSNTFLKTVSAFSNYNGGKIIFGVTDQGEYSGIDDAKNKAISIENKINNSVSPQVSYRIDIDEDSNTIILTVHPGDDKPYFYNSKVYKRNDSSTIEVDKLELKKLILQGQNKTFDALSVEIKDSGFDYLKKKLMESIGLVSLDNDVLKTLELMSRDGYLTNAGLLLSDKNDFKIMDIVKFGRNQDVIQNRLQLKNISILEAYDKSIEKIKEYYQYQVIKGAYRTKEDLIPEKAYREAIANALVHREWMIDSYIQVSMEDEFIVITSPGGLTEGIAEEEYLEGQRSLMRNPIIGNVFFRLDIIESFGTGIRRIKKAYQNSNKKPIFRVYGNSIEVKLPVVSNIDELSADQKKVYLALEHGGLASSEIADATGFGKNKVLNLVEDLIAKGYMKKTGSGRGTKYSIE